MARKVRNRSLDTREARSKLKPNPNTPHYIAVERGTHLGYRKLKGQAGTWVERRYLGGGKYAEASFATADDIDDADGAVILDYWQAFDAVRKHRRERAQEDAGIATRAFTVDDAMDLYCAALERLGRDDAAGTARGKYNAWAKAKLGKKEAGKVTTKAFEDLLDAIAKSPARLRTKPGAKPAFRVADKTDEGTRRRRATANRLWTVLKAALNASWRDGKIASDAAWRRVKTFEGVDGQRVDFFSVAEAKRLTDVCPSDFRKIVQAGLLTGGRWGALTALTVEDFNEDAGNIRFTTKKGRGVVKVFYCHLSREGVDFFRGACSGKTRRDRIFLRNDGEPWGTSHQLRPFAEAIEKAKIGRVMGFHHLRHTWASLWIMNGASLLVIAKNLGHSDTRMVEKHYGHLVPSYEKAEIQKHAPVFGIVGDVVAARDTMCRSTVVADAARILKAAIEDLWLGEVLIPDARHGYVNSHELVLWLEELAAPASDHQRSLTMIDAVNEAAFLRRTQSPNFTVGVLAAAEKIANPDAPGLFGALRRGAGWLAMRIMKDGAYPHGYNDFRRRLEAMVHAAEVLLSDAAPDAQVGAGLRDVIARAGRGAQSVPHRKGTARFYPAVESGQVAGRSGADRRTARLAQRGLESRELCAAIIGEAWAEARGDYPSPTRVAAHDACEILWATCGGDRSPKKTLPANSPWRGPLEVAKGRREHYGAWIRRHLFNRI